MLDGLLASHGSTPRCAIQYRYCECVGKSRLSTKEHDSHIGTQGSFTRHTRMGHELDALGRPELDYFTRVSQDQV